MTDYNIEATLVDKLGNQVRLHTTTEDYEEDLKKILGATEKIEEERKNQRTLTNPFTRYPDLMEGYNEALDRLIKDAQDPEEELKVSDAEHEFYKLHKFCLFMEKDSLGYAAVEYQKMRKETRLLVPDDIVQALRDDGRLEHFTTTNTGKSDIKF